LVTNIYVFEFSCSVKWENKKIPQVKQFQISIKKIVVIWWRSVLLMEDTGVLGKNHRPVASHWQTLSHNVVSSAPRHRQRDSNSQLWWFYLNIGFLWVWNVEQQFKSCSLTFNPFQNVYLDSLSVHLHPYPGARVAQWVR
jgi:hypothetical protein